MKNALFALALATTSFSHAGNLEYVTHVNNCVKALNNDMGEEKLVEYLAERAYGNVWEVEFFELCLKKAPNFPGAEELKKMIADNLAGNKAFNDEADSAAKNLEPASMNAAVAAYNKAIDTLIADAQNGKLEKERMAYELVSPRLGEELFLIGAAKENARTGTPEYKANLEKIYTAYARKQLAMASQLGMNEFFTMRTRVAEAIKKRPAPELSNDF